MTKLSILAALPLLALAGASHAGTWQIQFAATSTVWGPDSDIYPLTTLELNIVTADVLSNGAFSGTMGQGYQILSMSGTRNGEAVSGLLSTAGTTVPYSWSPDSYIYAGNPQAISFDGLMYRTANGDTFNLYGSTYSFGGPPETQWFEVAPFATSNPNSSLLMFQGGLTLAPVAAVPEPASWALMLAGAGMLGGLGRARRRATAGA